MRYSARTFQTGPPIKFYLLMFERVEGASINIVALQATCPGRDAMRCQMRLPPVVTSTDQSSLNSYLTSRAALFILPQ